MTRTISKSKRWMDAVAQAQSVIGKFEDLFDELAEALDGVNDVKEEYQEWYDNMPEGLQQSPTGERLSTICEFDTLSADDLREAINDLTSTIEEFENAELPQGFGRD